MLIDLKKNVNPTILASDRSIFTLTETCNLSMPIQFYPRYRIRRIKISHGLNRKVPQSGIKIGNRLSNNSSRNATGKVCFSESSSATRNTPLPRLRSNNQTFLNSFASISSRGTSYTFETLNCSNN